MEAFVGLQKTGKIRYYGVSNLDLSDMQELWQVGGGQGVATNQLLYNLTRRGIEWDLLPWLRERRIPVIAYSPIEQSKLVRNRKLSAFARENGMTPAQVALAWLLANDDVIAIPKTGNPARMKENAATLDYRLTKAELAELDRLFPPPSGPRPLEML
jgi:diketogulonate reductase-like aldo/keto reductase